MGAGTERLRVVLDTNTVVSALVFAQGRLAWLRIAWQSGRILPLVSRATTEELIRVLAYPKFRLEPQEIEALLEEYLPYVEVVPEAGEISDPLPPCRDPADRPFLELAQAGHAQALVTGDSDLLTLAGATPFAILHPAELREQL